MEIIRYRPSIAQGLSWTVPPMTDPIQRHCRELDRCNQRGGRMLSVFDLLAAGTLDLDLGAYLMARISRGASFIVGAVPGGAGKTTVMCALLNFVPAEVELVAVTPEVVSQASEAGTGSPYCYICHEIGAGSYFAYLWDEDLRRYCRLAAAGHMLATNLHADDPKQARDQVCRQNGVSEADFRRFNLLMFLRVEGDYWNARRQIVTVYESAGAGRHRLVYDVRSRTAPEVSGGGQAADLGYLQDCRKFLSRNLDAGTRTIEQSRYEVVKFLAEHE